MRRLFVVFLLLAAFEELTLDILPQLTLVVVLVPLGDTRVKVGLESESTSENGGNVDRVSLVQGRELIC